MPYTYSALRATDDIRLLRVHSVSGSNVNCTISPCSFALADEMGYYALSYCWGTDPPNESITVEGDSFSVTPNLLAALKAFHRLMDKSGELAKHNCFLWVDAICINQKDDREKSFQVRRMDKVYSRAEQVLVWLGSAYGETDKVMSIMCWLQQRHLKAYPPTSGPSFHVDVRTRLMSNFSDKYKQRAETWRKQGEVNRGARERRPITLDNGDLQYWTDKISADHDIALRTLEALFEALDARDRNENGGLEPKPVSRLRLRSALFPPEDSFWAGIASFYSRSWFRRVWTFQEVMLSRGAVVMCGEYWVNWEVVKAFRSNVSNLITRQLISSWMVKQTVGTKAATLLLFHNLDRTLFQGLDTLNDLVLRTWDGREASNPKDYIYGYVGILGTRYQESITVDYGLSDADVYASILKRAIEAPSGDITWGSTFDHHLCSTGKRVQDLPSWCPDFSAYTLGDYEEGSLGGGEVTGGGAHYFKSIPLRVSSDLKNLRISGAPLDTIIRACDYTCSSVEYGAATCRMFDSDFVEWLDVIQELCQHQHNDVRMSDWLQKFFLPPHIPPGEVLTHFRSMLHAARYVCNDITSGQGGDKLKYHNAPDEDSELHQPYALAGRGRLGNRGRYFFVTEKGRFGHAPKPVQAGQRICYFTGGKYMKVLSEEYERVVTSAVVDGLMGDAMLGYTGEHRVFNLR